MLPIFIEAEYLDGFIHRQDEEDRSLFEPETRPVFYDILNRLPEAEHGKMVRFSLVNTYMNERTDVDFLILPDNARPIFFMHREIDTDTLTMEIVAERLVGIDFGYQYTDEDGHNQQEVIFLRPNNEISMN